MYNSPFGSFPPTFSFQFNTPGSYSNFCLPHESLGMTGKIVVTPSVAAHIGANGEVTNFFDPDSVVIETGGTVEYYWRTGDHTITSGTGISDPNAGQMINSPLTFETPAVQLTFNSPGVYLFFCVPHDFEGMKTTVYVNPPCTCPCKYDPSCDAIISDVLDVVAAVNVAFRGTSGVQDPGCTAQRTDVNDDSATDVLDVVRVVNVAFRGFSIATQYVNPCL
jgi:plastocyanin